MPSSALTIPWATHTKVVDIHEINDGREIRSITLERGGDKAEISHFGDVSITLDSKHNIGEYLEKSEALTQSLKEYIEDNGMTFFYGVENWLAQKFTKTVYKDEALNAKDRSVLDWEPDAEVIQKTFKLGKIGQYGADVSSHITEDWIGSSFRFYSINFHDEEQGLAVEWPNSEEVEVWIGDVEGFVQGNVGDLDDTDHLQSLNEYFENGFLWALDEMGIFDGKKISLYPYKSGFKKMDVPDWAQKLIGHHYAFLWPELVEKIVPRLGEFSGVMETGIRLWVDRQRKEMEERTGQQYIWKRMLNFGGERYE